MTSPLLRVQGLRKYFPVTKGLLIMRTVGHVKAVDGISFDSREGETLRLVGESGCGKTTTSRLLLRLDTPPRGMCCSMARASLPWNARHYANIGPPCRRYYRIHGHR